MKKIESEYFRSDNFNELSNVTFRNYNINPSSYIKINKGVYKCKCNENEYFLKQCNIHSLNKYNFLNEMGVSNILYPIRNKRNQFVTQLDDDFENAYYISPFIKNHYVIDEVKAVDLIRELKKLHKQTSFKKTLDQTKSRPKMEEMFSHLNYKFSEIEGFIRSLECREFDEFSIPILKNYHYILDAKKIMLSLNKKIVLAIKEKKNVEFCFLHNNPKIEHLIKKDGQSYLISVENGVIGICSLDIAKFYIENTDVNIDMKNLIDEYFKDYNDKFYYDYFCFLVLLFYIETLNINDKDYVTSQSFIYASQGIRDFLKSFTPEKNEKKVV